MSEQWCNCILQRKVDNKEIEARCENGEWEDITGRKLVKSSYRMLEHRDDTENDHKIALVEINMSDILWFSISTIIVVGTCAYFMLK